MRVLPLVAAAAGGLVASEERRVKVRLHALEACTRSRSRQSLPLLLVVMMTLGWE